MINGQRVRKSLGIRDWQAAQRRARDMEAEGITVVGEAVTVQKATSDFERDAKSTSHREPSESTKLFLSD
jgi:hypothetical protein